jgi:hypothetical protein
MSDDLVLGLITTRVFGLLVFFRPCTSSAMQKLGFFVVKRDVTYDYLDAINFSLSKK